MIFWPKLLKTEKLFIDLKKLKNNNFRIALFSFFQILND